MATNFLFLQILGKVAANFLPGGNLHDMAIDICRERVSESDRRAELRALAAAQAEEIRRIISQIVQRELKDQGEEYRQEVTAYLESIPAGVKARSTAVVTDAAHATGQDPLRPARVFSEIQEADIPFVDEKEFLALLPKVPEKLTRFRLRNLL